jgi:hypothetical protein
VVDPLALWGAITGTAGLGITLRREVSGTRRRISVERGWQYLFVGDEAGERLRDVWVYVMAWNTGSRPVHIEHCGWEWLEPGPPELADEVGVDLGPENTVWVNRRVEIALNGETLEVVPDGPSVKVWTRIKPLLALGIDPTATPVRPFVVTVPEAYWWGSEGPLLARPPQGRPIEVVEEQLARLALEAIGEDEIDHGYPGQVVGVARLIMEGDVERTSDLWPRPGEGPPGEAESESSD